MVLFPGGLPRAIPQQTIPQVLLRPNYLKAGVQEASLSVDHPAVTNPSTARALPLRLGSSASSTGRTQMALSKLMVETLKKGHYLERSVLRKHRLRKGAVREL